MKVLIDLHTHSISSGHAYSTFAENVHQCSLIGLKYYGMSDHGPVCPGSAHRYHFMNLKVLPKQLEGVNVLKGAEVNVIDTDCNMDLEDSVLAKLDYAICSIHNFIIPNTLDEKTYTDMYLKMCDHPYVKILGHPESSEYPIDFDLVCEKAAKTNTLIELNSSSLIVGSSRKDSDIRMPMMIEACKRHNTYVIMGSDAHICFDIAKFDNVIAMLKEHDFPESLIVNYHEDLIEKFILSPKTM